VVSPCLSALLLPSWPRQRFLPRTAGERQGALLLCLVLAPHRGALLKAEQRGQVLPRKAEQRGQVLPRAFLIIETKCFLFVV